MSDPPRITESIEELLLAEHRLFDKLGRSVIATTIARDEEATRAAWNELGPVLAVHVDGEDQFLIPALMRRHGQQARALLAEHRLIRERVKEIDAAFAQGARPFNALRMFVDELNAHARHEAKVLYALCESLMDDEERALWVAYREEASKASRAASSSSTFSGFVR